MNSRSACVLVTRETKAAAALLGAAVLLQRALSSAARLNSIAVVPPARGCGIASRQLDESMKHSRDSAAAVLRLETPVENVASWHLFTRQGFGPLATALAAVRLIGDGFDGVDLKQTISSVFVIEIKDSPYLDRGAENKVLGNAVCRRLLAHLLAKFEGRESLEQEATCRVLQEAAMSR